MRGGPQPDNSPPKDQHERTHVGGYGFTAASDNCACTPTAQRKLLAKFKTYDDQVFFRQAPRSGGTGGFPLGPRGGLSPRAGASRPGSLPRPASGHGAA